MGNFGGKQKRFAGNIHDDHESGNKLVEGVGPDAESKTMPVKDVVAGCILAVMAGVFSGLQFGVIQIGKKAMKPNCTDCPAHDLYQHQFDTFGSYMVNFGIGTAIATPIYLGLLAIPEKMKGREAPPFHFDVLKIFGTIAGLCWVCGNVFQSSANNVGGGSVMGPANHAMQLITAGAWGLVYYREVKDPKRVLAWVFFALWTSVFVILFGREK